MRDFSEFNPHLTEKYDKVNHRLDGYLLETVKRFGHIAQLNCPICGKAVVLKDEGCQQCEFSFEVVLVVDNSHAFIGFLPDRDKLQHRHQLISLLASHQIQLPLKCPACPKDISFAFDALGKKKPFCKGVFFPPILKETGAIVFSCKDCNETCDEDGELRSLLLIEYRQAIDRIAAKFLSPDAVEQDTSTDPYSTEIDLRRAENVRMKASTKKNSQELIEEYISHKGSSATLQELVDYTGKTPQGVRKAINKMKDTGRLLRVRWGVYDIPKHRSV